MPISRNPYNPNNPARRPPYSQAPPMNRPTYTYAGGTANWHMYNAANRSEAVALDDWPDQEYAQRYRPRPARAKKPRTRYYQSAAQGYRPSPLVIFTLALTFAGAMLVALSFAAVSNQKVALSRAMAELSAQKESNLQAQAEINRNLDLKRIEEIATAKLGMAKPQACQIVMIHVPKQSYVTAQQTPAPQTADAGMQNGGSLFSFLTGGRYQ